MLDARARNFRNLIGRLRIQIRTALRLISQAVNRLTAVRRNICVIRLFIILIKTTTTLNIFKKYEEMEAHKRSIFTTLLLL